MIDYPLSYLIYIMLTGALAGLLSGLFGIGGGLIIVPILIWVFQHLNYAPELVVHMAIGTSLATIIFTSLSSTIGHSLRSNINWNQVIKLSLGGVIGGIIGPIFAVQLKGQFLKMLFGILEIYIGWRFLTSRSVIPKLRKIEENSLNLSLIGFFSGFLSSFFGVGGGIIAVPMMIVLMEIPVHIAIGNSNAMIVLNSLIGVIGYISYGLNIENPPQYTIGYVNYFNLILIAITSIPTAQLGTWITSRTNPMLLKKLFSIILIVIGLKLIFTF